MTPRVISKDEVRVGDKIRVTFDPSDGVVTDHTFTVVDVTGDHLYHFDRTRFGFVASAEADTITLLERPKPQFKVGDRVRRENPNGVTIEFTVHRVDSQRIYPQWGANPEAQDPGLGYNPERFELVQ